MDIDRVNELQEFIKKISLDAKNEIFGDSKMFLIGDFPKYISSIQRKFEIELETLLRDYSPNPFLSWWANDAHRNIESGYYRFEGAAIFKKICIKFCIGNKMASIDIMEKTLAISCRLQKVFEFAQTGLFLGEVQANSDQLPTTTPSNSQKNAIEALRTREYKRFNLLSAVGLHFSLDGDDFDMKIIIYRFSKEASLGDVLAACSIGGEPVSRVYEEQFRNLEHVNNFILMSGAKDKEEPLAPFTVRQFQVLLLALGRLTENSEIIKQSLQQGIYFIDSSNLQAFVDMFATHIMAICDSEKINDNESVKLVQSFIEKYSTSRLKAIELNDCFQYYLFHRSEDGLLFDTSGIESWLAGELSKLNSLKRGGLEQEYEKTSFKYLCDSFLSAKIAHKIIFTPNKKINGIEIDGAIQIENVLLLIDQHRVTRKKCYYHPSYNSWKNTSDSITKHLGKKIGHLKTFAKDPEIKSLEGIEFLAHVDLIPYAEYIDIEMYPDMYLTDTLPLAMKEEELVEHLKEFGVSKIINSSSAQKL